MRGAWLAKGIVGLVLLAGVPSACLATELFDRKLERAMMDIVAERMKADMRGALAHDWRMPVQTHEPVARETVLSERRQEDEHGSFVEFGRAASASATLRSARSILDVPPPRRTVRVVYF